MRECTKENLDRFSKMVNKEYWAGVYFAPVDNKFIVFNTFFLYYFDICFLMVKSKCSKELIFQHNNNIELENERKRIIELNKYIGQRNKKQRNFIKYQNFF